MQVMGQSSKSDNKMFFSVYRCTLASKCIQHLHHLLASCQVVSAKMSDESSTVMGFMSDTNYILLALRITSYY